MGTMELVGGELDGKEIPRITKASCPEVFYGVPGPDEKKIRDTKGNVAKSEMRDRLAVLAYKFDEETSTDDRFRMVRAPELDKVSRS